MIDLAVLTVGDEPEAWRAAGFVLDDGMAVAGAVAIHCAGDDRRTEWTLGAPALDGGDPAARPADIDGVPTAWGDVAAGAADGGGAAGQHANHVVALDHVVVASPDLDRTTAAFEAIGVACRRVRDAGSAERPLQQRFFRLGPAIVEVIGSPERRGEGRASIWGLAFTVADLDAAVASLGPACGPSKDAVQPGRRIATVRTRDLGVSVPIALMSPG